VLVGPISNSVAYWYGHCLEFNKVLAEIIRLESDFEEIERDDYMNDLQRDVYEKETGKYVEQETLAQSADPYAQEIVNMNAVLHDLESEHRHLSGQMEGKRSVLEALQDENTEKERGIRGLSDDIKKVVQQFEAAETMKECSMMSWEDKKGEYKRHKGERERAEVEGREIEQRILHLKEENTEISRCICNLQE
jgi:hypothetical protein